MNSAEFKRRMATLPEPPDGDPPYWDHWRHDLWARGQVEDPDGFMGWPCVYHTMLVNHWSMDFQLEQLRASPDWPYWETAIYAPEVGHPPGFCPDYHPHTWHSKNLINQAYHILQWEQRTGRRIEQLEHIVEVGGGYGALALVCRRLGFRGRYIIYDLPEFSLLQEWFLSQVGVDAECRSGFMYRGEYDLLIAVYSLSETPHAYRVSAFDRLSADSYLLVYSGAWQDYDNLDWFTGWTAGQPGYDWRHWPMVDENDRPDWYCVGWKT